MNQNTSAAKIWSAAANEYEKQAREARRAGDVEQYLAIMRRVAILRNKIHHILQQQYDVGLRRVAKEASSNDNTQRTTGRRKTTKAS